MSDREEGAYTVNRSRSEKTTLICETPGCTLRIRPDIVANLTAQLEDERQRGDFWRDSFRELERKVQAFTEALRILEKK